MTRGRKAYWNCVCECGKECVAAGGHLSRGGIASCGCYRKEASVRNGRKNQAIRRRNALATGVPWTVSKDFTKAKLTPELAATIRLEYAQGETTHKKLEAKYGVSDSAIHALIRGESWRDADGPIAPRSRDKLTAEAVRAIREEYARGGISHEKLAAKYSVTRTTISGIIHRKRWGHVK